MKQENAFSLMPLKSLCDIMDRIGASLEAKGTYRLTEKQRQMNIQILNETREAISEQMDYLYLSNPPRNSEMRLISFFNLTSEERVRFRQAWADLEGMEVFVPNKEFPIGMHAGFYFPDRDSIAVFNADYHNLPIPYPIESVRIVLPKYMESSV